MIIAAPHSSSFTFLWGGVILCTPPIAKRPRLIARGFVLGGYTQRLVFTLLTL
jgi:hypothetical protein